MEGAPDLSSVVTLTQPFGTLGFWRPFLHVQYDPAFAFSFFKPWQRWCQANANSSPLFAHEQVLGNEKVAPFAKSGVPVGFEG